MPRRDSHCSSCGAAFAAADVDGSRWPRTCGACGTVAYKNPLPVAVLLLPIGEKGEGVLVIRRGVAPRIGELALPGGYVGVGESWQEAGVRELFEETGIRVKPEEVGVFDVKSASDGTVLVFGIVRTPRALDALPPFHSTDETSERTVVWARDMPVALAFPLHFAVVVDYFARRG